MGVYSRHDRVRYRRESFGGIVLRVDRQETRFFNQGGAQIIEALADGLSMSSLDEHFSLDEGDATKIARFIDDLVAGGVAVPASAHGDRELHLGDDGNGYSAGTAPLGVEIELTLKCARACRYCAYEALPTFSTAGELTTSEWQDVLRALRDAGVFFVRFTGGDPLLRPDFSALLAFADSLDLIVTVGSDLTVLDDAVIAALAGTANLYALQTTLDGATPESADRLRGVGNFDRVIEGIRRLKRAGVPVIVGSVLTKANTDEIGDIARLVGALGADGYCVAPLYAAGRAQARSVQAQIPDNDDLARASTAFAKAIAAGYVRAADPAWHEVATAADGAELAALWADQPFLVRAPDQLVRIDPRGRLYTSVKLKPSLREDVYLGDIRSGDIVELWNRSERLAAIRELPRRDSYFGEVIDVRSPALAEWRQ